MKLFPLALTLLIAGLVFGIFLTSPIPEPAGDIAEYFGITESVLRHGGITLTPADQTALSNSLHPEYFSNPGYYISGTGGNRYPVHFIAYSLLLTPMRWMLQYAHIPDLKIFALANTLLFFGAITYIMLRFVHEPSKQIILAILALTSPLIFFLSWPGPDIFSLSLLLIALFWFYEGGILPAAALVAVASWHSQPMMVIAVSMLLYRAVSKNSHKYHGAALLSQMGILCLLAVPFIYNYLIFGTLTPWSILRDGWTSLNGFGIQNIRLQKLFEQFFDLNIGVFWYAPLLVIAGTASITAHIRDKKVLWLTMTFLTTLLAYQTNPAWHYGTSGFGPSRHAIVMIPFLIAATVWGAKSKPMWAGFMMAVLISQIFILSLNNYIFPVFSNTLVHSPMADFILSRWPALYNPTPEIFVDRTNHTDLDHPTSAVYGIHGTCKKAYVLARDIDMVTGICGSFPEPIRTQVFNPDTDGFYVTYE